MFYHQNRLAYQATIMFDEPKNSANVIMNYISGLNHLEVFCWDKINIDENSYEKYLEGKPVIFRGILNGKTIQEINHMVNGHPMEQLRLKFMGDEWLKCFDHYLGSMKRLKRVSFLAGVGEMNSFKGEGEVNE